MPVDNHFLLAQLDTVLDSVDEILQKMELPKEVKRRLIEYSYQVFMEAECAVIKQEEVDITV